MAEKEPQFVVNDRRKYRMEGNTLTENPDHKPSPVEAAPAASPAPQPVAETPAVAATAEAPAQKIAESATLATEPAGAEELVHMPADEYADQYGDPHGDFDDEAGDADTHGATAPGPYANMPPPPNEEETAAANRAYLATTERLDDLIRANDLGGKREAAIDFSRVAQSFYITAMMQLGFNTPPNQQIRVDLLGARQTIDMLAVVAEKTKGNVTGDEEKLVQSMLFELRMGFLEMAQAVAQSAQAQQAGGANRAPAAPGAAGAPGRVTPFPGQPRR